ncbi:rhodanese-like domain-containing protein [Ferrigenium sp. UT5]|uniref:rhodanese-like domain-containing protein n=1 Tax=Ferrigenium sp. UT5 TaxID=3242105 RepID=UPI0035541ACB
MKFRYALFALGVFLLSIAGCRADNVPLVEVKQAAEMQAQGALLLDVRQPDEYAEFRAPNSRLLPLGQLSSRMGEIASYKDRPVVVICHSGRRSARAVQQLQEAGFTQVFSVDGGMVRWAEAGLPVERGAPQQ